MRRKTPTRERLLDAAGALFAARGYRAATVSAICRKARANVAAVNYHFGSKRRLYVEAWRHEFHRSIAAHPPDGGVEAGAPAEERLGGRIRSILHRISDPASRDFDMMRKEQVSPTGLLSEAKKQALEPLQKGMEAVVRELLGPGASGRDVTLCKRSILSQCFGPMLHERLRAMRPPGEPAPCLPPPLEASADEMADHILRFSLAGIAEMRARGTSKARRKKGKKRP